MFLTLFEDPLQLHRAHQSCQKSASSCVGLKSEQLRSHHVPNRSNRGYQPPSLPRFHVASSNLESKEEMENSGKVSQRIKFNTEHWMFLLTSRFVMLPSLCLVLRWELDVGPEDEDGEGSWKQEMPDVCQLVQKMRLVLTCKSMASMRTLASPWKVCS